MRFGIALAAAGALVLAGCGTPTDEKTDSADGGSSKASDYLACMISDQGGFDDKSFNQSGYEGLERAVAELGIQKREAESKTDNDYQPNIDAMIQAKCKTIITVGFLLVDQTVTGAKKSPDTKFGIIDAQPDEAMDNVRALVFNTAEAAFLAGYLAAGMSETGTVATFGGAQIPAVSIFMDGFIEGVNHYNTENGAEVKALGWDPVTQQGTFVGNFEDTTKGQTISKNFIDQGADIIHPVAGPVGVGTLAAVKEANAAGKSVSVVWVDADGYDTNPDYQDLFLTSVVKEMGAAVFDTIKSDVEGKFTAEPYIGNLENEGVSLASFHDYEARVKEKGLDKKVDELKEKVISGEIKVETKNAP